MWLRPIYEDVPTFHNQSHAAAALLKEYVARGQDRAWYAAKRGELARVAPCGGFDNRWAVEHAAALFTNGGGETAALKRDYPTLPPVHEIMLGHDIGAEGNAEDFIRDYGVKDFIFCVGRIESRKNQLMLLKALEDCELPVVLGAGGFSYQPEYEDAVRRFRRRGQTVVLGRLTDDMLAAAYRAARVHILPSWYELPGLVSLEAAYYGCHVAATRRGTTADYFGEHAFYCDPADESSIYNAVIAAYYSPVKAGLKEVAMRYTWDSAGQQTMDAYNQVLSSTKEARTETVVEVRPAAAEPLGAGGYDLAGGVTEFQDLLEKGELSARRREYNLAHEWLSRAEKMNPHSARALRARGAVFFAEGANAQARTYFERAYSEDPRDARTLSGLGMCEMAANAPERAYDLFVRALELDGEHIVTLMQLVDCAYRLNRYDDLIRCLMAYNERHHDSVDMQFCLAGAMYKQGWHEKAAALNQKVLAAQPLHAGAQQLQALLAAVAPRTHAPADTPQVNAVAPAAAPTGAAEAAIGFDAIDQKLVDLEEEKRQKNYAAAHAGAQELVSRGGCRADQLERAKLLVAETEMLQGQLGNAGAIFADVLAGNPRSARALCGKGALSAVGQDLHQAEALFRQAHEIDPNYDVALAGLGLCAAWNNNREQAWGYYKRALEKNPENVRAVLGLIEIGYPLQRVPEVQRALERYLEFHPCDLDFVYSLAGCYFAQNRLEEAITEVNKITLFEPQHAKALELRGMIEKRMSGSAATWR